MCEDLNGGPPADAKVLITCVNSVTDAVLSSTTVIKGRNVTVSQDGHGGLPDSITCSVADQ
jgi:hypothetical protein